VKKICLLFLFVVAIGIALGGSQENASVPNNSANMPSVRYALVGDSEQFHVAVDLNKFALKRFEKNLARYSEMTQAEKDDIARRLMDDDSLDYVTLRLFNKTDKTMPLSADGVTLTVTFMKMQGTYKLGSDETHSAAGIPPRARAELSVPIATTLEAKMAVGRLAASISRIDYLIGQDLSQLGKSSQAMTKERPEWWIAPIARTILDQALSGELNLKEEGITVPLVFRVYTENPLALN
jgi:hypothetical protein